MKGTRSSDGHSPLSTPVFLNADRLQMIINSMKHGLSLGIPHFDIDPMNPELLGYLIIDAGEESQHYRNLVAMLLEENDLLREDPHIQTLADTRWAVATLDSDPPQEVWWGIHQQRLVVASGQAASRSTLRCVKVSGPASPTAGHTRKAFSVASEVHGSAHPSSSIYRPSLIRSSV
jgi:hypothetical protein